MLADYWRQRGELDKERRCLEKIAILDPEDTDTRRRLVEISDPD